MDQQLRKVKEISSDSISVFGGLSLVVLMGDFYQFVPVQGKALCSNPTGEKKVNGKSFWSRFTSILTLIEQIRQKTDLLFQKILKRAKEGKLDLRDVRILN